MASQTFHPFSRLPLELRLKIWRLTPEARIITVRLTYRNRRADGSFLPDPWMDSTKPIPPHPALTVPFRVCRESRREMQRLYVAPKEGDDYFCAAQQGQLVHWAIDTVFCPAILLVQYAAPDSPWYVFSNSCQASRDR